MPDKKHITLILGTGRAGRQSEKIALFLQQYLSARADYSVEYIDVKDHAPRYTIPPWENNPATAPWTELVNRTDGFVIVCPEYNHGYPGELKLLLDQELDAYAGKPILLCGVSSGGKGGARVVEQLVQVARELGLIALSRSLYFPNVKTLQDKSFEELFVESGQSIEKALAEMNQLLKLRE